MKRPRWPVTALTGFIGLTAVLLGAIYGVSERRLGRAVLGETHTVPLAADSEAIARGKHVALIRGCVRCHALDLGGQNHIDKRWVLHLEAPNLTRGRGGVARTYRSSAEWERAIRHGVSADGRALIGMPSNEFQGMSDLDLGDLIRFLESLPPVDRVHARSSVGLVGRVWYLQGRLPLLAAELHDSVSISLAAPTSGVSLEYGQYLAQTCTGCHGQTLSGGPIPGSLSVGPPPTNLTPDCITGIGMWTLAEFTRVLREGVRADNSRVDSAMPLQDFQVFSDDEIAALWTYLRSVPVRSYGSR